MKNSVEIKEIDRNIINIIKEITPLCGNLYLVGGALRDILNGVKPDDYDILTDYPTDSIIEKIKRNHKVKIARIENRINPLIRLDIDNGNILDLSTLQGQLSDNLSTRDFTVNSLAISINKLIKYDKTEIIDLFGGIEHAQHRILFPTTELSLKADPLRILRAFRIKLYKDYIFSETLSLDMKKHRKLIANVKGERLWMELKKILNHPDSYPVFSEIVNGKF
ncbi:MAG TPA: CCA tRNA nucleotidyltransferase, partial [Firmicutes bacterium]|nr:CCA tRNA nucleotidyltransferase [Bacillota bacterium]